MSWTDKYIGIPYRDMDCAEFIEHVAKYEQLLNQDFPKRANRNLDQRSNLIRDSMAAFVNKASGPADKCPVLLEMAGTLHVGLCAEINGEWYLLHSNAQNGSSNLARLDQYKQYVIGHYEFKHEIIPA